MPFLDNIQDRFALTGLGGMMGVNPATTGGWEQRLGMQKDSLQGFTPGEIAQWGGSQDSLGNPARGRGFQAPDAGAAYMGAYKSMMGGAQPQAIRFQDNTPRMIQQRQPVQAWNQNMGAMSDREKLAQILRGM